MNGEDSTIFGFLTGLCSIMDVEKILTEKVLIEIKNVYAKLELAHIILLRRGWFIWCTVPFHCLL